MVSFETVERLRKNGLVRSAAAFVPDDYALTLLLGFVPLSDQMVEIVSKVILQEAQKRKLSIAQLIFEDDIYADLKALVEIFTKYQETNQVQSSKEEHQNNFIA